VLSANLHRQHLDESQRAMVAAKLATLPFGSNQHTPIGAPSQAEAAEMLHVAQRSVQRAAVVRKNGSAALVAAVEQGKIAVSVGAKGLPGKSARMAPRPCVA
jgi:hypothetical protein